MSKPYDVFKKGDRVRLVDRSNMKIPATAPVEILGTVRKVEAALAQPGQAIYVKWDAQLYPLAEGGWYGHRFERVQSPADTLVDKIPLQVGDRVVARHVDGLEPIHAERLANRIGTITAIYNNSQYCDIRFEPVEGKPEPLGIGWKLQRFERVLLEPTDDKPFDLAQALRSTFAK